MRKALKPGECNQTIGEQLQRSTRAHLGEAWAKVVRIVSILSPILSSRPAVATHLAQNPDCLQHIFAACVEPSTNLYIEEDFRDIVKYALERIEARIKAEK